MLLGLHVKNLALIEKAEVEFTGGLNILTGETGAGKSILIGSVGLALGGKASKDMIRQGEDSALVELAFSVDDEKKKNALEALDIAPDEDGLLIISKKITPSRTVSRINDETVTTARLKAVTGLLLDIHGQHEHQSLLHKQRHLEILDEYSRNETENLKRDVEEGYRKYQVLREKLSGFHLDEETRNHYIDIAYQKALRLEQLTNELFGFVKLEHKEMQLHLGKLDLVQLMEQMLDEMTPSFVKNELQVEFLHAEHAIFLEADGELLARLFGNLLNNAVKYGKEGKQIRVSMEKEGEYVVTRVINYGRIIPKQELDHIFQKFYRTEQSRSRDTGGTGLGLAIVQQIAELHHGQVRVKSDLQGTVFEVELPVGMPKGKKEDEKR